MAIDQQLNALDMVIKRVWTQWSKCPEREDAYLSVKRQIYKALNQSGYVLKEDQNGE